MADKESLLFTKQTEEEQKADFHSCRYCFMGPGIYRVEDKGEISYLCEKHYQEVKAKGFLW